MVRVFGVCFMICVKLLPQHIAKCFERKYMKVREILRELEELANNGLVVIVNGKIADSVDVTVSEKDEVVVVQEFLGG